MVTLAPPCGAGWLNCTVPISASFPVTADLGKLIVICKGLGPGPPAPPVHAAGADAAPWNIRSASTTGATHRNVPGDPQSFLERHIIHSLFFSRIPAFSIAWCSITYLLAASNVLIRYYHCPGLNVQFAPPPSFCSISCGSMAQARCEKLVKIVPAAPSEATPAADAVALSSLAWRPFKVIFCVPKVTSQERSPISTLLIRQTTASAFTEIF